MQEICSDLAAEHAELDGIVAGLDETEWRRATPAAGWTIADSVSHLWFFDQRARWAVSPETVDRFLTDARDLTSAVERSVDPSIAPGRAITGSELLERWRTARAAPSR